MTRYIAFAALAAATLAAPLAAQATPMDEARIAAVRYGDLDLDSEAGQRTLQRRIEAAAREVCGTEERITGSLMPSTSSQTCYAHALNSLEREIAARTDYQPQRG